MAKKLGFNLADDFYKNVLKRFPSQVSYCFAYGSAVFPQQNQKPGKMLDLVFVVDDPLEWHTENMAMNYGHYSAIRFLGPKFVSRVQENMASGIFYNPFATVDGKLIKYGVISTRAFTEDLTEWKNLYIAGRLHKPVRNLRSPVKSLIPSIEKNRMAALRLALINLPEYTSTFDLYVFISRLSYTGDFRMHVGEHPQKAVNIVVPLMKEFDKIYYPILKTLRPDVQLDAGGRILHKISPKNTFEHLMKLPVSVQISVVKKAGRPPKYFCVEDTLVDLCYGKSDIKPMLNKEISHIVASSSIRQTLQGILSAGIFRSIRYGLDKIKKKTGAASESSTAESHTSRVLSPDEIAQMKLMGEGSKKVIVAGGGPLFDDDFHPGVGDCDYLAEPAPQVPQIAPGEKKLIVEKDAFKSVQDVEEEEKKEFEDWLETGSKAAAKSRATSVVISGSIRGPSEMTSEHQFQPMNSDQPQILHFRDMEEPVVESISGKNKGSKKKGNKSQRQPKNGAKLESDKPVDVPKGTKSAPKEKSVKPAREEEHIDL